MRKRAIKRENERKKKIKRHSERKHRVFAQVFTDARLHYNGRRCIVHTMMYAIAIAYAIVMIAVQAALTRAVSRSRSAVLRGILLGIKFPLWAGFFLVLAFWEVQALWTGGLAVIVGYLAITIGWMIRAHRRE